MEEQGIIDLDSGVMRADPFSVFSGWTQFAAVLRVPQGMLGFPFCSKDVIEYRNALRRRRAFDLLQVFLDCAGPRLEDHGNIPISLALGDPE